MDPNASFTMVEVPFGKRPGDQVSCYDKYGLHYRVQVPPNNRGEAFKVRLGSGGEFIAARDNNIGALQGILAETRRVPCDVRRRSDGWTLLHAAAEGGAPEMLRWVIRHGGSKHPLGPGSTGVNPNAVTHPGGKSAAHVAASRGHVAALECLFELGADLQLRDSGGARPLHDAAAAGDVPTVELLGTMRGEVDAVTNDGSTAALIAARAGMAESLRCLAVMCEANLRIPNRSGETVASIAAMHRHGAVLDVLSALGHNTGHVNRPAAISEPSSLMPNATLPTASVVVYECAACTFQNHAVGEPAAAPPRCEMCEGTNLRPCALSPPPLKPPRPPPAPPAGGGYLMKRSYSAPTEYAGPGRDALPGESVETLKRTGSVSIDALSEDASHLCSRASFSIDEMMSSSDAATSVEGRGGGGAADSDGIPIAQFDQFHESLPVLNKPGRWDFFISHTQRSGRATTLATKLFSDLNQPGETSAWLDVEMQDKSEAAMREGVENSHVVLAIVTDEGVEGDAYFERPYCLEELRWAQTSEVFIQPIVAVEDKQRIGEMLLKAPSDLRDLLGSTDFIHLDRGDIDYWKVGMAKVMRVLKSKKAKARWQRAGQQAATGHGADGSGGEASLSLLASRVQHVKRSESEAYATPLSHEMQNEEETVDRSFRAFSM